MRDPFPFSSPAFLSDLVRPFAERFGLKTLPIHIHEVLFAFTLYHFVCLVLSPYLSARLFPSTYPKFNKRTKVNWDIHVVSLFQSTLINILALWVNFVDRERGGMNWQARVWGYTGALGMIQGFACGYFLWDLWISTRYVGIFGLGLLAHAVCALTVFSLGFRPFLNYYGTTFILYELSSPFLNIHWFCDKLSLTGSNIQLYNGILLIFTFFSCRLVWGTYSSVRVIYDVVRALMHPGASTAHQGQVVLDGKRVMMRFAGDESVPMWLALSYLAANITLHSLNFFWFGKMIETIRKRFDPPFGTRVATEKQEKKLEPEGHVLVKGVDVDTDTNGETKVSGDEDELSITKGVNADGKTTVGVEKTEVRQRRK